MRRTLKFSVCLISSAAHPEEKQMGAGINWWINEDLQVRLTEPITDSSGIVQFLMYPHGLQQYSHLFYWLWKQFTWQTCQVEERLVISCRLSPLADGRFMCVDCFHLREHENTLSCIFVLQNLHLNARNLETLFRLLLMNATAFFRLSAQMMQRAMLPCFQAVGQSCERQKKKKKSVCGDSGTCSSACS